MTKTVKMEAILVSKDGKNSSDAAYRELAKHCKDELSLEMDEEDPDEEPHEIEVANVSETYEEQYESLNESYFPSGSETIALKVIDNQLSEYFADRFWHTISFHMRIYLQIITFQRHRQQIWLQYRKRVIFYRRM